MKLRLAACVVLLSIGCSAGAQTTEADIAARLVGKPLLLRGFWSGDQLQFRADGKPTESYGVRSFTESAVDVKSVKVRSDRLTIAGRRVGIVFDKDGKISRVPLEKMSIEIEAAGVPGFGKAIDAVFAEQLADITPSLPAYWQPYARQHFLHEEPPPGRKNFFGYASSSTEKVLHVGGGVIPPRLVHSVDPQFDPIARQRRVAANVLIYLWVEPDGTPSHLEIARPGGMGLDEEALAAVEQYKFAPATLNGNAVTVDLYIAVNFQIF